MIEKKSQWHFCYWDEPNFINEKPITNEQENNSSTGRTEIINKGN